MNLPRFGFAGKLYRVQREQRFDKDVQTEWNFIAPPQNLQSITPPKMNFQVVSPNGDVAMHAGQIIAYRVKPLFNLPVNWVTEITHVQPGQYFVDQQRFGLYAFWHHLHRLQQQNGQTVMTDIVYRKLPFGIFGALASGLVEQRWKEIFDYRRRVPQEMFC